MNGMMFLYQTNWWLQEPAGRNQKADGLLESQSLLMMSEVSSKIPAGRTGAWRDSHLLVS